MNTHPAFAALIDELRGNDYGYSADGDTLTVWREYGQRLLREATYWEPAEYTEEYSECLTVKIESNAYVLIGEDGKAFFTTPVFYEGDPESGYDAVGVEEALNKRIPYRDLQAEHDDAYGEYLIECYFDRAYA